MATTFSNKVAILSELWFDHKDNELLQEFVGYNDLGLPLAYNVHHGLSTITDEGMVYVNQTYDLLCNGLGLDPEYDYQSLDELMTAENHLQSEVQNFIQSKIELEKKCQNLQNNLEIYNQENNRLAQILLEKRQEIHSLETCLSYLKNEYDYLQPRYYDASKNLHYIKLIAEKFIKLSKQ